MAKLPGGRVGGLLSVLLLAVCGTDSARADLPREVSIEWSGDCPRPFALEAEVSQLLGGKRPELERTEFEVDVDAKDGVFELTLEVDSKTQNAERKVRLPSCPEVQDAAVLLIATAIDPDAALRAPKPPPPPPPPPKPPEPPAAPTPSYRWSLLLRGLFDLQSTPGPTVGPSLGGLWQEEHWRFWADLRYLPGRTASDDLPVEVDARVDLFAGAVGASHVWALGPFVFGPAVEVEAGVLRARDIRGPQLTVSATHGPWACASFGALAAYGVTRRIGVELGVFAGVPLRRPELSVRGGNPFYTTDSLTMRLALAARVSLGSR